MEINILSRVLDPYSGPFGLGQTMIPQYMMPQTAAYQITDANQACKRHLYTL